MPRPPRPPPLPTVPVCKARGTRRGGEGAPPPLWGRGCCRCRVAREEEAVAAAAAANMFSVRIVTADYYMASPLPGLDTCQCPRTRAPVQKVPVVRVFGATPAGKRAPGASGSRWGGGGCPPRRAHAAGPCDASLPRLPPLRLSSRCVTRGRDVGAGEAAGRRVFTARAAAASGSRTPGRRAGGVSARRLGRVAAPGPASTGS